jgi:hypothetical protein
VIKNCPSDNCFNNCGAYYNHWTVDCRDVEKKARCSWVLTRQGHLVQNLCRLECMEIVVPSTLMSFHQTIFISYWEWLEVIYVCELERFPYATFSGMNNVTPERCMSSRSLSIPGPTSIPTGMRKWLSAVIFSVKFTEILLAPPSAATLKYRRTWTRRHGFIFTHWSSSFIYLFSNIFFKSERVAFDNYFNTHRRMHARVNAQLF